MFFFIVGRDRSDRRRDRSRDRSRSRDRREIHLRYLSGWARAHIHYCTDEKSSNWIEVEMEHVGDNFFWKVIFFSFVTLYN